MAGYRESPLMRLVRWWFCRRLLKALSLDERGEVRSDGLLPNHFKNKLELEWPARSVHPWDKGLSPSKINRLFAEQCLEDTSRAIEQLFLRLPEIESIDFRVVDPNSLVTIVRGSVRRDELKAMRGQSSGMKLKNLGATYHLRDFSFEPLD